MNLSKATRKLLPRRKCRLYIRKYLRLISLARFKMGGVFPRNKNRYKGIRTDRLCMEQDGV